MYQRLWFKKDLPYIKIEDESIKNYFNEDKWTVIPGLNLKDLSDVDVDS